MAMPRRPIPVGFAEDAMENARYLVGKYHCSYYQISRWREELGLSHRKQPVNSVAVIQLDSYGNEISRYESYHDAAKAVNGNYVNISCAARGKTKKAYGFTWRIANENNVS